MTLQITHPFVSAKPQSADSGIVSKNAWNDAHTITAAALSAIGRASNSVGAVTDMSTSSGSYAVLRESGGVLSFGAIDLTTAAVTGILPITNGGTGASAAFTIGSVLFAGASGVYSQDNSHFFWDDTNDRLGLGTTSPAGRLGITSTGLNKGLVAIQTATGIVAAGSGELDEGWSANRIILSDNGIDTSGLSAGIQTSNALYVAYKGSGTKAIGQSIFGTLNITGTPATSSNTLNQFVAGQFIGQVSVNLGGTNTGAGAVGAIFGLGATGIAADAATNLLNVTGGEINAGILTGCSAKSFSLLSLASLGNHAVAAATYNAGLSISAIGGALGIANGILFSDYNGAHAIVSTGSLFKTQGSSTVANAFDTSSYSITGYFANFVGSGGSGIGGSWAGSGAITLSLTSLSGSDPTYAGDIRIIGWSGGTGQTLAKAGGLEFKVATASNGYGHRLFSADLGAGSAPLVFQYRGGSASWSESARITETGLWGIGASSGLSSLLTVNGAVTLGTQQTTQGSLILSNTAVGSFATTLKASNSASAAWTLTLPTTAGSASALLQTNGSGVSSWAVISSDASIAAGGALTLASIISSGGPTGSATVAPIITWDAKGRLTAVTSATITPAVGSITGLGSGVATFLATPTAANFVAMTTLTALSSLVTVGTIASGTWSATTIAVDKGGTGLTSYAVGDLLYASGSATISKLADVATGSVLVSGGVTTAPTWSATPTLTQLTTTNSAGSSGSMGLATAVTQTTANAGDTGDKAFALDYTLTATNANQLVVRTFAFNFTNNLTNSKLIGDARLINLILHSNASTNSTATSAIYLETGTASGTVTTAYGLRIVSMYGTTKFGIYDQASDYWYCGGGLGVGTTSNIPTGGLVVNGVVRINQTPSAIGTGAKTVSSSADSSTNFGHYASFNMNGTTYYFPCGATAPT